MSWVGPVATSRADSGVEAGDHPSKRAGEEFLWGISPLLIVGICWFIFNCVRSPLLVYREEAGKAKQRVDQAETRATQAESALAQEKDKAQPKFELNWAPPSIGEGVIITNGYEEKVADIYIQVSVLNRGAPSVINGCKGIVRLKDGSQLESLSYEPAEAHISMRVPHGRISLPTSPSLIKVWANTPIPTGGRGFGYILFKFPSGTKGKMSGPGGAFILKIWDIAGKEYKTEIPWSAATGPTNDVFSLPGMPPVR